MFSILCENRLCVIFLCFSTRGISLGKWLVGRTNLLSCCSFGTECLKSEVLSCFISNWLRNFSSITAVFVAFSTSLNPKEPSAFRSPFASPFCVPLTVSYGVRKRLFAKILLQRWHSKHFLCQLDSSPQHPQENDLLLFCCIPNSTINGNQQSYYIQDVPEESFHYSGEGNFGSFISI